MLLLLFLEAVQIFKTDDICKNVTLQLAERCLKKLGRCLTNQGK